MGSVLDEEREEGREEGIKIGGEKKMLLSLRNLIANVGWTLEQAMDALGVPEEEKPAYRKQLQA